MMNRIVRVEDLQKIYKLGKVGVGALQGVTFDVLAGSFTSIMGPSGCGKSTLMHLIGCLDTPTSGKVFIENDEVSGFSDNELAKIRNKKIGFVFQMFNLLPRLNAAENVELPLIYSGVSREERMERSLKALSQVGLFDRAYHKPSEISGGEMQRIAIARALVNNPSIILADEPTGNLDTKSSYEIMDVFTKLNSMGVTIIMVTHEPDIAKYSKRIIHLRDGKIVKDEANR